ncbi:MAG: DUF748 domain-containing protein [Phycisphaerae bacterium]|nr:DUF748 domain-containing protein [Phycisphaerae bacterium]
MGTLLARRLVVRRVEIDGMDVNVTRRADGTFPQFRQLLRSLPTEKSEIVGPDAETEPEFVLRDEIDLTPPVKLDALRLQHVQITFRDESVSPVLESRLDVNVRLSDLGSEKRDTRFQVILSSPPVLDQLLVEGTGSSLGMDLIADTKLVLNGLHLRPLKDYLATFGISPDADSLSLACSGQIRTRGIEGILKGELESSPDPEVKAGRSEMPSVPRVLNVHFDMNDVLLSADGLENLALSRLAIDANLPRSDTVDFSKIELVEGRVHAWRRANEALSVAGLQFTGRPEGRDTSREQSHTAADSSIKVKRAEPVQTNTSTFKWSASNLSLRDLQLVLHDESVSPNTDVALQVKSVDVQDVGPQDSRLGQLSLLAEIGMPGVVETVHLEGSAKPFSAGKTATLRVSSGGIRPDALAPYLETLGLESLHRNGELACNIDVVFGSQGDGRISGEVSITDILLEDENELFGLKAISLQGVTFDPNSGTTRIEDISISGQSLALGRDKSGYFNGLGFRLVGNEGGLQRKESAADSLRPDRLPSGNLRAMSADVESSGVSPNGSAQKTEAGKTAQSISRIEIGRFSWRDNNVTFVDESVWPVKSISVPDFGVELDNLTLDFSGDPASPGNLKAWLRAPGIVQQIMVNGSVSTKKDGFALSLDLASEGITATEVAPYLEALGMESTIANGALQARLEADLAWTEGNVNCSLAFRDVALGDGEKMLASLKHLDVDKLQLGTGDVAVERIELDQPYLTISREQTGLLNLAGIRLRPKEESRPSAEPQPTKRTDVSHISIRDAHLHWHDDAVKPAVSQNLIASATLKGLALGFDAPPAAADITLEVPGVLTAAGLSGKLYLRPSEWGADLDLEATGIDMEALSPYFAAGHRPVLKNANFSGGLTARLAKHREGGHQASLSLSNIDYRNDSGETPLLSLDSANAVLSRFDPDAQIMSFEELSIHGLKAVGERKTPDRLSLLGFEFQSGVSEVDSVRGHDDETVEDSNSLIEELVADANVPPQGQNKTKDQRSRSRRLPLITLASLDLQLEELILRDLTRSETSPIILSDFLIRNRQPVRLLGEDPDSNPAVNIDIKGKIQPLARSLALKTELSPFAAQPRIQAEWDIEQINGGGLCSVVPELTGVIDPNGLRNGQISGRAELTLALDRRDILDFDLSKPFGLDLLVNDVEFTNADSNTILVGLDELHADIPRVDLARGSVHVKEIGLIRPKGSIWREDDGLHVLGVTLKAFAKKDIVDPNRVKGSKAMGDEGIAVSHDDRAGNGPDEPAVRVDQVLVNEIDFTFVDRTTDPAMHIPLKGMDVEIRDFTTRSTKATKPIRFNAIVTAGEVSLARKDAGQVADSNSLADSKSAEARPLPGDLGTMERRLLFQEMSATGRLALYPRPEGWVKAGLSGLELVNFRGTANQVGMTLSDGILDGSVDIRFRGEGKVSTRSRLVFTDLSLTEPPDGFLLRLLSLPTSLDTVLFILQDSDGAIRLPLAFKMDEDGLSRGQVTSAAIGATAAVIANAVAGSPFRLAGTVGGILGVEGEEETALETHFLQYAPGVTVTSEGQLREFEALLTQLRKDKNKTATIRHQLGGGDVEHAAALVNLSPEDALSLLDQLKQDKATLQMTRDQFSSRAQAAYAAGNHTEARDQTQRLQEIERRLGLVERAIDDLLEMMRPGTEHAAKRRTRDACLAIGKARLNALADALASTATPDMRNRIKFIPPRFVETEGHSGGTVSITLGTNKVR